MSAAPAQEVKETLQKEEIEQIKKNIDAISNIVKKVDTTPENGFEQAKKQFDSFLQSAKDITPQGLKDSLQNVQKGIDQIKDPNVQEAAMQRFNADVEKKKKQLGKFSSDALRMAKTLGSDTKQKFQSIMSMIPGLRGSPPAVSGGKKSMKKRRQIISKSKSLKKNLSLSKNRSLKKK